MHHSQVDKNERLEKARQHAISEGGECLSDEYVHSNVKMKWKCEENHIWEATPKHIFSKTKSWCPICRGRKPPNEKLQDIKEYAISQGGECLSDEYVNANTKMIWKCEENHIWSTTASSILNDKTWCYVCEKEKRKNPNGLQLAQDYAKSKNGECLSAEYLGAKKKLKWKCENDHIWDSEYRNTVTTKTWCPQCAFYYYKEHKIRDLLEYLIGHKFLKSRPTWNINPKTDKLLELDGYCKEINTAFEFQGKHHYDLTGFTRNEEELDYIKYKDVAKKQNCLDNGVCLLIIDDIFSMSDYDGILKYVLQILETNSISYNKNYDINEIKEILSTNTNHQANYLELAKKHALKKKGFCLSEEYINSGTKLKWKCEFGHEWMASYSHIISKNRWCKTCYYTRGKKK